VFLDAASRHLKMMSNCVHGVVGKLKIAIETKAGMRKTKKLDAAKNANLKKANSSSNLPAHGVNSDSTIGGGNPVQKTKKPVILSAAESAATTTAKPVTAPVPVASIKPRKKPPTETSWGNWAVPFGRRVFYDTTTKPPSKKIRY